MNSIKSFYVWQLKLCAAGILSMSLAGCEGDSQPLSLGAEGSLTSPTGRVSLMKANTDDISKFRVECPNKSDTAVCVLICHRPPGNPLNEKEKVLPLPALFAHLNHGHSNLPDTLGPCGDWGESEDPPGEEPGAEGPADDSGEAPEDETGDDQPGEEPGGTDEETVDESIPEWCRANLDIDADCDGYHDELDFPIY